MLHGQNLNSSRAMTLMELLIALVLFTLVVLGIGNIEIFCRHVFTGSDRKAKVINEAGYVLEHMSKFIGGAVGDAVNRPVDLTPPAFCTKATIVWVDYPDIATGGVNGIWDSGDRRIMYCFNQTDHMITFYPHYLGAGTGFEVIARNIDDFNPGIEGNAVPVSITGCWNASIPASDPRACGSVDNPRLTLQTRIIMPSVSIESP